MDVVAACLPDSRGTRMSALPVLSAGELEVEISDGYLKKLAKIN